MLREKEEWKRREDLLLLSGLGALGGTRVVANLLSEANRHGDVTVIYGNYSHLFFRGSMRDAETPDVWLKNKTKYSYST